MHDSGLSFATSDIRRTRRRARSSPKSCSPTSIAAWSASARSSRRTAFQSSHYRATKPTTSSARSRGKASRPGLNVVVVSGDKDFQQLVRPGVWLLNPGRGGPASVEEQWVGVENGSERLGVPPALRHRLSRARRRLVRQRARREGHRREDGAGAGELVRLAREHSRARRRDHEEASARSAARAGATWRCCRRSSSRSATISTSRSISTRCASTAGSRRDCARSTWSSSSTRSRKDVAARRAARRRRRRSAPAAPSTHYVTVDTIARARAGRRARARSAPYIALDTETVDRPGSAARRSIRCAATLVGIYDRRRARRGVLLPARASRRATDRRATSLRSRRARRRGRADDATRRRRRRAQEDGGEPSRRASRRARWRARGASQSRTCRRSTIPRWRRSARCSRIRPCQEDGAEREVRSCSRCARAGVDAARPRLRHDGRELRPRSRAAARTGSTCSRSSSSTTR